MLGKATTRKFNGQIYHRYETKDTKREAQTRANYYRSRGNKVRVVKTGKNYTIYVK